MQTGQLPIWRSALDNPQPLIRGLCIAIVAGLIGLEVWPSIKTSLNTASATSLRNTAQRDVANVDQIAQADLFGHAANQNGNLPQTDLQVTLRAVFAASDPKMASAVIEMSDGRTLMVKVGGALDTSATLQAVYPNRVVLSRNGALETLYFPAPQESAMSNLAQNTPAPNAANPPTGNDTAADTASEEIKRAAILQRLEELRMRTSH